MSVCGHADEESVSEEVGAPVRDLYQEKSASKVVRVLTVVAYLLSVSLAAILLSVYYVCVWKAPELPLDDEGEMSAQRSEDVHDNYTHGMMATFTYTGGSNISMNDAMQDTFANSSNFAHNSSGSERDSDSGPSTDPIDLSSYFEDPPNSTAAGETTFDATNSVT